MRTSILLFLFLSALFAPRAIAKDEASQAEIDYLIRYVENSSVRFVRSGKEYSPKEAADHLRYKLAHSGGRVKTAEDFIVGIATKSYLSGRAYQIKLPDGSLRPTSAWLNEALARYRKQPQRM
jgi:hypothetical protein